MSSSSTTGVPSIIPPSIPSLLLPKHRTDVDMEIEKHMGKRKVSAMSTTPNEFLNNQISLLENEDNILKLTARRLQAAFLDAGGQLPDKEFQQGLHAISRKRAKLSRKLLTVRRHSGEILETLVEAADSRENNVSLADAYASSLLNFMNPTRPLKNFRANYWRKRALKYYDSKEDLNGYIWCPIMKEYNESCIRKAAHIVSHSIGYQAASYIFNVPDGRAALWELRNSLVINSTLATKLDDGTFTLVPVVEETTTQAAAGEPARYRVLLVNETLRNSTACFNVTWDELDGRELQFLNDNRPARRYLYYHYVMTLLNAKYTGMKGWEEKMRLTTGTLWAKTPGKYLRESMLRKLAEQIGDDVDLPEEIVEAGMFSEQTVDDGEEALMALDLYAGNVEMAEEAERRRKKWEDMESDSEEEEEESAEEEEEEE